PGRARRMDILGTLLGRPGKGARPASVRLGLEQLEPRSVPAATASLAGGILTVQGDAARDNIKVVFDQATAQLVVFNFAAEIGRFASASVGSISINGGGGRDVITVDRAVTQPALLVGGNDGVILRGGGGITTLLSGAGNDKLVAGRGTSLIDGDGGRNRIL